MEVLPYTSYPQRMHLSKAALDQSVSARHSENRDGVASFSVKTRRLGRALRTSENAAADDHLWSATISSYKLTPLDR